MRQFAITRPVAFLVTHALVGPLVTPLVYSALAGYVSIGIVTEPYGLFAVFTIVMSYAMFGPVLVLTGLAQALVVGGVVHWRRKISPVLMTASALAVGTLVFIRQERAFDHDPGALLLYASSVIGLAASAFYSLADRTLVPYAEATSDASDSSEFVWDQDHIHMIRKPEPKRTRGHK